MICSFLFYFDLRGIRTAVIGSSDLFSGVITTALFGALTVIVMFSLEMTLSISIIMSALTEMVISSPEYSLLIVSLADIDNALSSAVTVSLSFFICIWIDVIPLSAHTFTRLIV